MSGIEVTISDGVTWEADEQSGAWALGRVRERLPDPNGVLSGLLEPERTYISLVDLTVHEFGQIVEAARQSMLAPAPDIWSAAALLQFGESVADDNRTAGIRSLMPLGATAQLRWSGKPNWPDLVATWRTVAPELLPSRDARQTSGPALLEELGRRDSWFAWIDPRLTEVWMQSEANASRLTWRAHPGRGVVNPDRLRHLAMSLAAVTNAEYAAVHVLTRPEVVETTDPRTPPAFHGALRYLDIGETDLSGRPRIRWSTGIAGDAGGVASEVAGVDVSVVGALTWFTIGQRAPNDFTYADYRLGRDGLAAAMPRTWSR